ncbi:MAG TPA: glycosyltransferase family 39 protein [Vicinamibacterales bacterium]|nr:glycosyltransferase family 39 protein [Vicinamibacterales bacterium]
MAAAALLYFPGLGNTPVYLAGDEVFFGLSAHSVAFTGRDLNGRFLPLYFQWPPSIAPDVWFHPMEVYLTAPILRLLPLSEWSVRLPTVLLAMADIALMYSVAKRIFKRESLAIGAASLLTLTPAHFINSRIAMDFLYPLVFVMGWLLCLLTFLDRRRLWMLFVGTSLLGLGFYSYIAAVVMMPIYVAITALTLLKTEPRPGRALAVAAGGFAWPLIAVFIFVLNNSAAVGDTAGRYGFRSLVETGQVHGVTMLRVLATITDRISLYWRFFDPAYLFVAGGGFATGNTHRVGVFLMPVALFLLVGLNEIVNVRRSWANFVLILGLATAPLAACLVGEPYAVQRELFLLPFVILIAIYGVESLLSARHRPTRLVGWWALAAIPLQFVLFFTDYHTTYRTRSAFAFEGNLRGAIEEVIDTPNVSNRVVYLSTDIRYIEIYWKLYLIKHHREDFLRRTVYFDPKRLEAGTVPRHSLLVVSAVKGAGEALVGSGQFRRLSLVANIDRTLCCEILERTMAGPGGS